MVIWDWFVEAKKKKKILDFVQQVYAWKLHSCDKRVRDGEHGALRLVVLKTFDGLMFNTVED